METAVRSAAASLFCVLFPANCRICRTLLTTISNLPVCDECLNQIVPLAGTLCSACGEKLVGSRLADEPAPLCDVCRRASPRFRKAVAYGAYQGALRDLLHVFKYQGVRSAAPRLGRLLGHAVTVAGIKGPLWVVPVPLAPRKQRSRGFNQAEEIARTFTRQRLGASIQLESASLVRVRETISQTGLTRHQRQSNLRGAFSVVRPGKLRGKTVLLVDDVMTTGATASECTRVLLRAGVSEVFVATVARATRETENVLVRAAGAISGGTTGHA